MAKKKSLEWQNCSEKELHSHVAAWLGEVDLKNTVVFLEGDMGAGKSTFVRALLEVLAPDQLSQGSPTFPIVQEYRAQAGFPIYHIDLYRLKNEGELQDSGIEAQLEEPESLAFVEWGSLFPEALSFWFDETARRRKTVYQVFISEGETSEARSYFISEA